MAGAAAVKQESDALLCTTPRDFVMHCRPSLVSHVWRWRVSTDYRIDCWSAYSGGGIRNISDTLEVLDFKYCDGASSDGEGLLILPSPSGVLSTIHFEVPPLRLCSVSLHALRTFTKIILRNHHRVLSGTR